MKLHNEEPAHKHNQMLTFSVWSALIRPVMSMVIVDKVPHFGQSDI